jgi:tetratricopeptide (TPR) repeat protein
LASADRPLLERARPTRFGFRTIDDRKLAQFGTCSRGSTFADARDVPSTPRSNADTSHDTRVDVLERAVRVAPDDAATRDLLAFALLQSGQLERALVVYESLLLEAPSSIAAKLNVAVVLLRFARPSAARPLLEEIVAALPGHRRAWGYLGVAFEQLGLVADAERAFVAGEHATAARRLRERHAGAVASPEPATAAPIAASTSDMPAEHFHEITFEDLRAFASEPPPASGAQRRSRAATPFFDAALASLLEP